MRKLLKKNKISTKLDGTKRGDTMIEVLLASAIFGFISLLTITLMNSGLRIAQANLQMTMARNEITAQTEALRYIHNAYISSPAGLSTYNQYRDLWNKIVEEATIITESERSTSTEDDTVACSELYEGVSNDNSKIEVRNNHSLILNTNAVSLDLEKTVLYKSSASNKLNPTDSYPYIEFDANNNILSANGIWINVEGVKENSASSSDPPRYYDFYISSCWYSAMTEAPTTLDTVIRLYNPNYWL